ncbi:transcriptional regulator, partial [Streptomyces sp. JV178]
ETAGRDGGGAGCATAGDGAVLGVVPGGGGGAGRGSRGGGVGRAGGG